MHERHAAARPRKGHSLQVVEAPVLEQLGVPGDSMFDQLAKLKREKAHLYSFW